MNGALLPPNRILLLILVFIASILLWRSCSGGVPSREPINVNVSVPSVTSSPSMPAPVSPPVTQTQTTTTTATETTTTRTTTTATADPATETTTATADPATDAVTAPADPTVRPVENCGAVPPATAGAVARLFGGSASQWVKQDASGQYPGWSYRSHGSRWLRFIVPAGCAVKTPKDLLRPGQEVVATEFD